MTPYYTSPDGSIVLYLGDCREVLPTLDRGSVGLCVTDPPYGIQYATNRVVRGVGASWRGRRIAGDGDTSLRDAALAWAPKLPALVFGSWKVAAPSDTRSVLVWDKGPASGMGDLRLPWKTSWELIYVIGDGFRGSRDEGVIKGYTVVTWESQGRMHPNEKPVPLLRYLIGKHGADTVIDPFLGSGTTARACLDLGRRCIGIEVHEPFLEVAAQRLSQQVLAFEATA